MIASVFGIRENGDGMKQYMSVKSAFKDPNTKDSTLHGSDTIVTTHSVFRSRYLPFSYLD